MQSTTLDANAETDFNQQLFDPIQVSLAGVWEKAFQRRLPHILQSFSKIGSELLKKFHTAVELRCREKGHSISRIGLLGTQLTTYRNIFNDLTTTMITRINDGQREINREFTPVIAAAMEPAYQACADERGTGSYKRMKGHMAEHVDHNKLSMFNAACDQVRNSLSGLIDNVRTEMLDRADSIFVSMQRDYMSIIGGVNVGHVTIPREERVLRREVDERITSVDAMFQRVVDSDLEDLKHHDAATDDAAGDEDDDAESVVSSQQSDVDGEKGLEEDEESDIDDDHEKDAEEEEAVADEGVEGSDEEFHDASSSAEGGL